MADGRIACDARSPSFMDPAALTVFFVVSFGIQWLWRGHTQHALESWLWILGMLCMSVAAFTRHRSGRFGCPVFMTIGGGYCLFILLFALGNAHGAAFVAYVRLSGNAALISCIWAALGFTSAQLSRVLPRQRHLLRLPAPPYATPPSAALPHAHGATERNDKRVASVLTLEIAALPLLFRQKPTATEALFPPPRRAKPHICKFTGDGHLNPPPPSPPRRWRLALGGGGPPPEEMAFGAGGSETPSLAVGVRSWGVTSRKVDDGTTW